MLRLKKHILNHLSITLCSCLVAFNILSSFIGISDVYATSLTESTGALTALYELFLSVGSTVLLTSGVIDNVDNVTEIDVAQFGADFLVNKMGLTTESADLICDFFIPKAYNQISGSYADAFTAYHNGNITLEELKACNPAAESAFNVYINNKWQDLCSAVSSFVDDVVAGSNTLSYGGHVLAAEDICYDGDYDLVGDQYSYQCVATSIGSKGYTYVYTFNELSTEKLAGYKSSGTYSFIGTIGNTYTFHKFYINEKMYNSDGALIDDKTYEMTFLGRSDGETSIACNIPLFATMEEAIDFVMGKIDDSTCINKETVADKFDYTTVVSGITSGLSNFVSKGAYKASDLYNTLADTFSHVMDGSITDSSAYVSSIVSALDNITAYDTGGNIIDSGGSVEGDETITPSVPSDDAAVIDWLKYIANTLSMSWTAGSDIPDILTGIGDYAQDIPSILSGLNDGFSDVIDVGGNIWEHVAEIPDIIDKQTDALLEDLSKGFSDVIDIGNTLAEEVAEMPDIIDFGTDEILTGILSIPSSISDALSIPLTGVLEGIDVHTGILTGINEKIGALDLTDGITLENLKELLLSLIDYTGLLEKIIALLQSILDAIDDFFAWFIIDFDAIKQHLLLALSSVPAFSGYEDFLALIDSAKGQVTDSYDYPVIEMDTPEILLPYYKHATIVLLDFEDYATYFIWVRTAMAFAILFGFCMWLIRDIKVSFTLN